MPAEKTPAPKSDADESKSFIPGARKVTAYSWAAVYLLLAPLLAA